MELDEYQRLAAETDQRTGTEGESLLIPLLGLAGETGSLLSEYKKRARDGEGHTTFVAKVEEELGDVLWYLSNLATKAGLAMDDIAASNLEKTRGRWLDDATAPALFDEGFPPGEQLPRQFEVRFDYENSTGQSRVVITLEAKQVGGKLTDNSYNEDGYRFHDAFHFTFAALLGWSPVTRRNLQRKRKSDSRIDEVEDGGRGWVIEEAIAALAFAYASEHEFFERVQTVDQQLLRTIRTLTMTAEVRVRSAKEWERAVIAGGQIFKQLRDQGGGSLKGDLTSRTIEYVSGE
jgi:NTP pyrophosphatase (non-canonical NTP hydrolase)